MVIGNLQKWEQSRSGWLNPMIALKQRQGARRESREDCVRDNHFVARAGESNNSPPRFCGRLSRCNHTVGKRIQLNGSLAFLLQSSGEEAEYPGGCQKNWPIQPNPPPFNFKNLITKGDTPKV